MGTYAIIGLADRDGNVSMWCLDTNVGRIVMIFSDTRKLAEVVTYAERHGKDPDHKIAKVTFTVDSPAQVLPQVEKLRLASGALSMNYVLEGEEMFDELLATIREQNAASG